MADEYDATDDGQHQELVGRIEPELSEVQAPDGCELVGAYWVD